MKLKNKLLISLPLVCVLTTSIITPLISCSNNTNNANNHSNLQIKNIEYNNSNSIPFNSYNQLVDKIKNNYHTELEKIKVNSLFAQILNVGNLDVINVSYDEQNKYITVTCKNNIIYNIKNPYNYLYEKNNVFNDSNLTNLIDSNILTFPSEIQTISVGEIYNKTSYPIVYNNMANNVTKTINDIFNNYFSTNPSNTTQTPIETIYSRYKNDLTFIFENIINEILSKSNQQIFNLKPFLAIHNNQNKFDVFFQVKNVSNEPINLFINNITLNPNSLLSLKLSFVINADQSNIQPNIYYFNNSYKIGYCINNANLQYQIDNNPDIKYQNFKFDIPYSYSINTEVKDVSNKYDVYNYHTTITNNIKSLYQNLFIQNLKQQIQTYIENDFNNTKTILVNVFQILEFINPFTVNSVNNSIEFLPLKIKQFLTGIGNQIFNILKNINEPLAVVLGNLFSDQTPTFSSNFLPNPVASNATTSGFLYNSFNAIIALLNNLYDKTNSKVILEVRNILTKLLLNKDFNYYKNFVTNLSSYKNIVLNLLKIFNVQDNNINIILSLLDSFSSNDNIWTLIDKNIITILDLIIALTSNTNNSPNQQAINNILINIKNLIITLRNGSNNTLNLDFWNIINQSTIKYINPILENIIKLLPSNLHKIVNLLQKILNKYNNQTTPMIRHLLYDITHPTFTNNNITKMSDYFNTEFVLDNSTSLDFSTINFNSSNKITGNISYSYTLNSGFEVKMNNLKKIISNITNIPSILLPIKNVKINPKTLIEQQLSFNNSCLKPYVKDKKLYWFITGLKQFTNKQTLNNFLPSSLLNNIFWKDTNINIYTSILLDNNDNNIYNYFYTDIINYDYCINTNFSTTQIQVLTNLLNQSITGYIDQNSTLYNEIMKILLGQQNINKFYYSFNIKYIYEKGLIFDTKTLEITPAIKVLKYDSNNNKYSFDESPIIINLK